MNLSGYNTRALTSSPVDIGTFAASRTSYTSSVAHGVNKVTVEPTLSNSAASYVMRIHGGQTTGWGWLFVGSNVITVEVTSEDGTTTKTYTVTITRAAASTDATLSGLTLSNVDFGTFASDTTSYTASVAYSVSETTVTPTVNHSGARRVIKLDGRPVSLRQLLFGHVPLSVGSNVFTVDVTAEDGSTTRTYTVTVTRAAASIDATLSGLTLSSIDFSTFASDTASYTAEVDSSVTETTVTSTVNDSGASYVIKLGGEEVPNGTVALATGSNVITVEVTAEDDSTTKTYTVTVTCLVTSQQNQASSDATLSGLTLSGIGFGTFSSDTTSYTAGVAHSVSETTVTLTVTDSGASYEIRLGGTTDADGTLSLSVGSNVITVEVTAEDGSTTETYTVAVTRAATPSTDASLSGLTLSGIDFGTFDSATTSYAVSVANSVSETAVSPTVNDSGASYVIKLGRTTDADGTLSLSVGSNVITVEVTAEDDSTTKAYTVTVTRAVPTPPLTATTYGVPNSHDGNSTFTFELCFSETPKDDFSYKILRDHAFTVTGGEVTKARRLERGKNVKWEITVQPSGNGDVTVVLPATTDCAAQGAICTNDNRMLSSTLELTVPLQNSAATGGPTISGTVQVGEALTSSTTGVSDSDGMTNTTYAYQWLADDAEISGATGSSYTLVASDEGKAIKVRVSFTDDRGHQESLTSAATPSVEARPDSQATGAPTISGTAQVGETLTADTSGISDSDGLDNVAFVYQWLADDTEISGAAGSSYTLTEFEEGQAIKVRVSFSDDAGNEETLTSTATGSVVAPPSPLTASVSAAPESHDGHFTFELRFSENLDGFSYKTLRDHAFTVTGGEVTKARRLAPPSNIGWEITVTPDGNGAVTIVLPVTTDCGAQGAICTSDGRMLSNRNELTVSGPVD